MHCPHCKDHPLTPSFLDGLVRAHSCQQCHGNWLLIEDYIAWRERNPEHQFSQSNVFEIIDSKHALLCPVTQSIMQKFKTTHSSDHKLDYSASVGGIWLDNGEWEYLKDNNIAGSLNSIFTSQWQKQLREESTQHAFSDIYEEKFGASNYQTVKEIRQWLSEQDNQADLRAYIVATDPYSADR